MASRFKILRKHPLCCYAGFRKLNLVPVSASRYAEYRESNRARKQPVRLYRTNILNAKECFIRKERGKSLLFANRALRFRYLSIWCLRISRRLYRDFYSPKIDKFSKFLTFLMINHKLHACLSYKKFFFFKIVYLLLINLYIFSDLKLRERRARKKELLYILIILRY